MRVYVNGEQRTWFDKYNDYIYLGLFLGSGLGSVAAGMFTWMGGRNSREPQVPAQASSRRRSMRCATHARPQELDAAEREADDDVPLGVRDGIGR